MKAVYFYNRGEFVQNGIADWTNYETMISTAKDIQKVLEGGYDYETLKNIQETLEKVIRYYDGFENDESIDVKTSAGCYSANLGRLKDDVKEAMAYYTMEDTGWLGRAYYQNKGFLKNCMTKIGTKLRDMSRGVVYDGPSCGNHFFHVLNPEEDIYTYNGRNFYLWDGWHSSLKVMKELQDICGISKTLHTHIFRKTYGTRLLNRNVRLETVSKCLGHSNTQITASTYAKLLRETIIKEVSQAITTR